jgi:hypothetical protein
LSDRKSITVSDHPVFIPNAVPPAPSLRFPNGGKALTLGEALFLPLNQLANLPTPFLNLLCATMLPDAHELSIPQCMKIFFEWTEIVRRETERKLWKFKRNPADFENSEAYFRVLVMITTLQRDLGVKYDAEAAKRKTFDSSREGFIHGLLTGGKTGTCANMPVLYASIGRNLGYPIYIACARGHLFCRWQSVKTGERFNIEASGPGLNTFSDDHYMKWPRPIEPAEVHHGIFLRNLEPMEELGCFMATRGHCLRDKGHILDAIVAYSHAHRLAPSDPSYMNFLLTALNEEIDQRRVGKMPCTYRQAEQSIREAGLPQTRFVIDDRYTDRIGGVNLDETPPGRLAPNN